MYQCFQVIKGSKLAEIKLQFLERGLGYEVGPIGGEAGLLGPVR